jgi:uncharacterized protein YqgC (DUF456 family)
MLNQPEQDQIKKTLKKITGGILIILGILGLFLPFTPGIAIIILGIILLGNHKLIILVKKIKNKFIQTIKK